MHHDAKSNHIFFISNFYTFRLFIDIGKVYCLVQASRPLIRSGHWIFFTFSMLSSLTEVDGRLAWGKFSTTSRPSLNALYNSNTCVLELLKTVFLTFNAFSSSLSVSRSRAISSAERKIFIFYPENEHLYS